MYNIVRRLSAVRKVVTVKIVGRFENVATGKGEAAAVFYFEFEFHFFENLSIGACTVGDL